jgi:hypothetical protein
MPVIEPLNARLITRLLSEALVRLHKLAAKAVDFTGRAKNDASLVLGEWLSLQPRFPAL